MTRPPRASVLAWLSASLLTAAAHAAAPPPARGTHGMAATAHPLASEAALEMLKAGGNAVDAAVAATFVISVVEPMSAGLGGGGFALVHLAAHDQVPAQMRALDFREKAPARATQNMFLDDKGAVVADRAVDGALSVAVPGTVPGLVALHQQHGKLPWKKLLGPAIRAARDGFVVGPKFVSSFQWRHAAMTRFAETRAVFMKKDKAGKEVPLVAGDRLVQRDLAKSLQAIANDPRAATSGSVGRAMAAAVASNGGILSADDVASFAPTWRTPVCEDVRDLKLCTMPPPSSGGVILFEMLHLFADVDLAKGGWHDVDGLHRMIEAMRIAYADRAVHLGDPAFTPSPTAGLLSPAYAAMRRQQIDPLHARKSTDVKAADAATLEKLARESQDTSHLAVADDAGNAVSLTFTINYGFGSGLVAAGTGILMNDEMDDFAAAPGVPNSYGLVGGAANAVAAGKIPLSSMTPAIATKNGAFALALGAPGGSTIITTVLQTFLHKTVFGMDCQAAVAAPRFHHQWLPDVVRVDRYGFDEATLRALEARGHKVERSDRPWGDAMCVARNSDGSFEGGADTRGEGAALGY